MKYLPLPATAAEDDAVVTDICNDAYWRSHQANWLATYAAYRHHTADPWKLDPFDFGGDVASRQYALYTSRSSSAPFEAIRYKPGLRACPVCGSPTLGSLDHYLPRVTFPEFAILRANLLPACTHCNTGGKRQTYKGDRSPKRFIHPYFDAWASDVLWHIQFVRPLEAATFLATPSPSLAPDRAELVQFHLDNVLGKEFRRAMESSWGDLHLTIRSRAEINPDRTMAQLVNDELAQYDRRGPNNWDSAFFRGLSLDREAMDFIWERVQRPTPKPKIWLQPPAALAAAQP